MEDSEEGNVDDLIFTLRSLEGPGPEGWMCGLWVPFEVWVSEG